MADGTPYDALRQAVMAYGEAAMENFLRCRALGYAIAKEFPAFLGAPAQAVALVPPQGAFNPKNDYGDQAFSYDPKRPIRLEPIAFGLCLTIPNAEDSGSMWIRTMLRLEIADNCFDVYVDDQPRVRIPLAFEGALEPVFEALQAEFMQTFRQELEDFGDSRYQNRLGFVTDTPT
ncbi:MAG: hypothetical protein AAF830_08550 [Pseudomonadota bacterium]